MSALPPIAFQNRFLESLALANINSFLTQLEQIKLVRGRILCEAGDSPEYFYFPLSGVISLLSTTEAGEIIEVAMIGNEGTTALPIMVHSAEIPYRAVVQVPGEALRIESRILQDELRRNHKFQNRLLCYSHSLFIEIAQSAVCNRFNTAEQRFCRWLLCTHDRLQSDTVELTHEIISETLGVQRSLVSVTAGVFQKLGLIDYSRGLITVKDRLGLEAASCECYRVVRRQVSLCSPANSLHIQPQPSG